MCIYANIRTCEYNFHMLYMCVGFCVVGLSSMQAAMFTYNEIYQVSVCMSVLYIHCNTAVYCKASVYICIIVYVQYTVLYMNIYTSYIYR